MSTANEKQPFVIFALPRSGTGLLVSLLDSHREITCHHEPFALERVGTQYRVLRLGVFRLLRDRFPCRFADFLLSKSGADRIVGFKVLDYQAPAVQEHLLASPRVRKILLRRDNVVAGLTSDKIAQAVKQWHVQDPQDRRSTKVEISTRDIEMRVERARRFYGRIEARAAESPNEFITVEYNQLCDRAQQQRILRFLGVDDSVALTPGMYKQNPAQLSERIVNWDHVRSYLVDTGRQDWIREENPTS